MWLQKELETYQRELPNLLDREGKFALVHGDQVASVWSTWEDALQAGYLQFGLERFLVKQIWATEPVHYLPHVVPLPCRS